RLRAPRFRLRAPRFGETSPCDREGWSRGLAVKQPRGGSRLHRSAVMEARGAAAALQLLLKIAVRRFLARRERHRRRHWRVFIPVVVGERGAVGLGGDQLHESGGVWLSAALAAARLLNGRPPWNHFR